MSDKIKKGTHGATDKDKYVAVKDQNVIDKLEEFKDKKLGFLTHFGMYTQLGMVESWALSDELKESRWSQEGIDWVDDIELFKQEYINLNKSFNPLRFDPQRFANAIINAGFKYVLMPTKHHDGFCMWDTAYTDYKVTAQTCPYHINKNADIFGALTREFQKRGLMTGAYFSKADWNVETYWPEEFKKSGATHRNVGYDINEYPEKWEEFAQFTKNQMLEIVEKYQPIDIMWLDGGQVKAGNNQDIHMDDIVKAMRKINKNLIVADRTVGGEHENYITPEQSIPTSYLDVPWESCISLGGPFAYDFNDKYKTPKELVDIFVEVLCKGGNLALNVAPQPDGRLPHQALVVLSKFGDWVNKNENAIFGTRPLAPYYMNKNGLVQTKDKRRFLFVDPKEALVVPKYIYIGFDYPIKRVKYETTEIEVTRIGEKYRFTMPNTVVDKEAPIYYVFELV